MSGNWGDYEGRTAGDWRLELLLGVREDKAFYLTHDAGGKNELLIELAPNGHGSAQLPKSWNLACKVPHGHLLPIHATGETDLDGTPTLYAVLDLPDDDLGEILARRKLDNVEARSIFTAVAKGLDVLHRQGLSHGAVKPSNIFVVRGEIRLSADTISQRGEDGIESDLRQFGDTLVQAITARSGATGAALLASPFYEIAAGCLTNSPDGKWTARHILEALSVEERVSPPAPVEQRRTAARQSFASWLAGPQWPIMATAAIVAVVLGIYLLVHGPRPRRQQANDMPAPVAAQVQPQPAEAPAPAPATAGAADRSAAPPAPAGHWAVIAATYDSFSGAQKLVERIQKQSRGLQPHVFPRAGQGKHYFVVLGSGLTQGAAQRLLRNAKSQGAPPDTYVTKLDETG